MTNSTAQPLPLSGCNIALSGTFPVGTHRVVQDQPLSLGAKLAGLVISNTTTHLVTKQRDYDKPSTKVKGARDRNLCIITYEWVKECLATNSKVPEEKYMLTTPPVAAPLQSNSLVKRESLRGVSTEMSRLTSSSGPKPVGKTNFLPKTTGN